MAGSQGVLYELKCCSHQIPTYDNVCMLHPLPMPHPSVSLLHPLSCVMIPPYIPPMWAWPYMDHQAHLLCYKIECWDALILQDTLHVPAMWVCPQAPVIMSYTVLLSVFLLEHHTCTHILNQWTLTFLHELMPANINTYSGNKMWSWEGMEIPPPLYTK